MLLTYPFPAPGVVNQLGPIYIVLFIVTYLLVGSRIIYRIVPPLRVILPQKKYALMAVVSSTLFTFVYFLLVNQIVISGFNALGTVSPPSGSYPYTSTMVPGVVNTFIDLVYLPVVIFQPIAQINFILVPFEMIFAMILALLVSSNIVMVHYLISNSGLRCSTRGTVMSTGWFHTWTYCNLPDLSWAHSNLCNVWRSNSYYRNIFQFLRSCSPAHFEYCHFDYEHYVSI